MIHFVVNKQEAVVCSVELLYFNGRILGVMTVNIQAEPVADMLRIDSCRHSSFPFVKQREYGVIHIVVNKNNRMSGLSYQIGHETVSVKHLPVIEYTLYGWSVRIQPLEDFFNAPVRRLLMLLHFQLVIFYCFEPLEQSGIGSNETPH